MEFGIAALLAVAVSLFGHAAYGVYLYRRRVLDARVWLAVALAYAGVLLAGTILYIAGGSYIILAFSIFAPPAALSLHISHRVWVANNFYLLEGVAVGRPGVGLVKGVVGRLSALPALIAGRLQNPAPADDRFKRAHELSAAAAVAAAATARSAAAALAATHGTHASSAPPGHAGAGDIDSGATAAVRDDEHRSGGVGVGAAAGEHVGAGGGAGATALADAAPGSGPSAAAAATEAMSTGVPAADHGARMRAFTILGGALLAFAFVLGMCIMISITVPSPSWLGYAIFCGITILLLTLLTAELWFNTLKPSTLLLLMLALAVVLHLSLHIWLLAAFRDEFECVGCCCCYCCRCCLLLLWLLAAAAAAPLVVCIVPDVRRRHAALSSYACQWWRTRASRYSWRRSTSSATTTTIRAVS